MCFFGSVFFCIMVQNVQLKYRDRTVCVEHTERLLWGGCRFKH
jgi:hypothetical protein